MACFCAFFSAASREVKSHQGVGPEVSLHGKQSSCTELGSASHEFPGKNTRALPYGSAINVEHLAGRGFPRESLHLLVAALLQALAQRLIEQHAMQPAHDLEDVL